MAEELKKQRRNIKSAQTRFKTFLDKFDRSNLVLVRELKLRLENRVNLLAEFSEIQNQIEILESQPEHEILHETEREAFESVYYQLNAVALQFVEPELQFEQGGTSTIRSSHTSSSHHSNNTNQISNNLRNIKLPTLTLPSFSGDYEQWMDFYDTFKTLINNNQNLSEIEKFHYLLSSLKGDALATIKSLEVSAENYTAAWDLLKRNFEKKAPIIENHIKALFELPHINKESHTLLKQLLNDTLKHIRALKSMDQPTDSWDALIIYLTSTKFDPITKRDWEQKKGELTELPTVKDLTEFLTKKCQLLHTLQTNVKQLPTKFERVNIRSSSHVVSDSKPVCKICNGLHPLFHCKTFLKLSIPARINELTKLRLCKNCFKPHPTKTCIASNCRKCNLKHNTLVHLSNNQNQPISEDNIAQNNTDDSIPISQPSVPSTVGLNCTYTNRTHVLLPTAMVFVYDKNGQKLQCRILLDSASQSNFVTQQLFELLGCSSQRINFPVSGINNSVSQINRETKIKIESRYNSFNCTISCLVLPNITQILPQEHLSFNQCQIPSNLQLADPEFNIPGEIQILVGAEIFWKLMCIGQISLGKDQPMAQKTHLGWIISGSTSLPNLTKTQAINCLLTTNKIDDNLAVQNQLLSFWKLEEVGQANAKTKDQRYTETFFNETTTRNNQGQFIVRLPFKNNDQQLGESYDIAKKRLLLLEKRFHSNPELKQMYTNFMHEYLSLGHMSCVNYTTELVAKAYFLPHHAVIKSNSSTSKIRVVFDGSCKTSSGVSLNEMLRVGPTIQPDLFSILIRFRLHQHAFTSDCEKTYRQVLIHKKDRIYQNILWRENHTQPIQTYQLNTVTYGTASAPYLSTRCLIQIAHDVQANDPEVAKVIKECFYIDDLICSTDNLNDAINLVNNISKALASASFTLRKWSSNMPQILENLENTVTTMHFNEESNAVKTLGLIWNASQDNFSFPVQFDSPTQVTKRTILSVVSKLFDPLGLVGPIIITSKIILQRLWQLHLDWDESIPADLHTIWTSFLSELHLCPQPVDIQLHAFCDASERSYGACVYLRSTDLNDAHAVNLLCAKSRVAPIKTITLARLELCAALLLSRLIKQLKSQLTIEINAYFFWSDSTIVLAWLKKEPNLLNTFVANRVSEITSDTAMGSWNHVKSADNPADIISRGVTPTKLANLTLWWNGPSWLAENQSHWPISNLNTDQTQVPELKRSNPILTLTCSTHFDFTLNLIQKFSNLNKLRRVLAYTFRFIKNSRKSSSSQLHGSLSVDEINFSMNHLRKVVQSVAFAEDIANLKLNKSLGSTSKLLSLSPFLDADQLLRVGGRLKHAEISYDKKHPILLPSKGYFTTLIVRNYHLETFHAGPQVLLSAIRQVYWPISGNAAVKPVINNCIICKRIAKGKIEPIMGSLPKSRITPSRPFSFCGVDYAGPFLIRENKRRGRGGATSKAYLCIFVCFSTKAVHLETVSSLSSEAFLACLKRFISRRGLCVEICSDNGSNFVSANKEIQSWYQLIESNQHNQIVADFLSKYSIKWKFIPARSPHFGGLWEAAVKSVKNI